MSPFKTVLMCCAALAMTACSPSAPAGDDAKTETAAATFDQTAAEAELLEWARARYNQEGGSLLEPLYYFFGDFTGDGVNDALIFSYVATGGSSAALWPTIHQGGADGFTYLKEVEVYGQEPRDAKFELGRITITTLMPGPNDPHCCPTQPEEWVIETN